MLDIDDGEGIDDAPSDGVESARNAATAAVTAESAESPPLLSDTKLLPIFSFREEILKGVRENPFLVVIGETGSGKTTQLCQYLLDAKLADGKEGRIAITQPRRVAAIGSAHRVASERGCEVGDEVGYMVRLDQACGRNTRIKFLTDGLLLRECLDSPSLEQYSIVILDEAHERSVATDVMFALLKKASALRPALRVLITSATLDGDKFAEYFGNCPVIRVPGRQYPVEVTWQAIGKSVGNHTGNIARTVAEAVVRLHMTEAEGHILGFLTGQDEVEKACNLVVVKLKELEEKGAEPPDYDIWVLPCYGAMTASQQSDIFRPVPPNTRKVILATNIAETSITVQARPNHFEDAETSVGAVLVPPALIACHRARAGHPVRRRLGLRQAEHLRPLVGDEHAAGAAHLARAGDTAGGAGGTDGAGQVHPALRPERVPADEA
eukprot:SAG11_NODE_1134_length_5734_cov_4.917480_5_plen_438_part_00